MKSRKSIKREWLSNPTKSGWYWWWHPVQAPKGICVLVHDDAEEHIRQWWVYLPKRAYPVRLGSLEQGSQWQGPLKKPQVPA